MDLLFLIDLWHVILKHASSFAWDCGPTLLAWLLAAPSPTPDLSVPPGLNSTNGQPPPFPGAAIPFPGPHSLASPSLHQRLGSARALTSPGSLCLIRLSPGSSTTAQPPADPGAPGPSASLLSLARQAASYHTSLSFSAHLCSADEKHTLRQLCYFRTCQIQLLGTASPALTLTASLNHTQF